MTSKQVIHDYQGFLDTKVLFNFLQKLAYGININIQNASHYVALWDTVQFCAKNPNMWTID